jgi:single-strand DNA-binding protein
MNTDHCDRGSLRTRSWEQDGVKRYATEIIASEMQMLDGKQSSAAPQEQRQAPRHEDGVQPVGQFDDDIPF